MTLIDTHCHLNFPPLADDVDVVLARAAARGVTRVVVPAYDLGSWEAVAELAERPHIYAALGIHPWLAHDPLAPAEDEKVPLEVPPTPDLAALLPLAVALHRPVAIGEIGLDTKIDTSGLVEQFSLLETQLAVAADLDLPVILHCRGAFEELLTALNKHGGNLRGVLHAYSRGPDLAERFIAAGMHIALGGAVTRDRARRVRKTAVRLPLDRLLLETDAPSIGLDGVLPEQTEPQHVADIARTVAALRDEPFETIAAQSTANAVDLFRLEA